MGTTTAEKNAFRDTQAHFIDDEDDLKIIGPIIATMAEQCNFLSSDSVPTIGHIFRLIDELTAVCDAAILKAENGKFPNSKAVALHFKEEINLAFDPFRDSEPLKLATLLTPSAACILDADKFGELWKLLEHIIESEAEDKANAEAAVKAAKLAAAAAAAGQEPQGGAGAGAAGPKPANKGAGLRALLPAGPAGGAAAPLVATQVAATLEQLSKERLVYLAHLVSLCDRIDATPEVKIDDLAEWRTIKDAMPLTAPIARRILPMQPATIASERIFNRLKKASGNGTFAPAHIESYCMTAANVTRMRKDAPGWLPKLDEADEDEAGVTTLMEALDLEKKAAAAAGAEADEAAEAEAEEVEAVAHDAE